MGRVLLSAWLARLFHGGVEKRLHDVGNCLIDRNFEAELICANCIGSDPYPHERRFELVETFLPFHPYKFGAKFKRKLEAYSMLAGAVQLSKRKLEFDLCHARWLNGWPAIKNNIPLIIDMPGMAQGWKNLGGSVGKMMVESVAEAKHFIAVTDMARHQMIKDGIEANKISRVYTGVDVDSLNAGDRQRALAKFKLRDDCRYVVSVQNLIQKKRTDALIDIFLTLPVSDPDWHLLIVGAGPYFSRLSQRISEERNYNVSLLGYVNNSDIPDIYALADIVAMCSVSEGAPITYFEALATCKPIVATRSGAVGEYLEHGVNCLLSEEFDDSLFAQNLAAMIRSKDLRVSCAEASQDKAAYWGIDRMTDECLEAYQKVSGNAF
jgi:glycosyltransferase involved in cell wall biosynthesis